MDDGQQPLEEQLTAYELVGKLATVLGEYMKESQAWKSKLLEMIELIRQTIPVQCKLGHWNPRDEVCPYCAKLETDIIADNCDDLTDKEKCEDGLCDCDEGECVAND